MDEWTYGCMDEWTDGGKDRWRKGQIDKSQMEGKKDDEID